MESQLTVRRSCVGQRLQVQADSPPSSHLQAYSSELDRVLSQLDAVGIADAAGETNGEVEGADRTATK